MEVISITWITVSIIVTISFILCGNFSKKSKLPPGPTPLPIIGNLHRISNLPHRSLCSLAQKYGPIMTVYLGSSPAIVISSPDMAKQVLKTQDHVFASRPVHGENNHILNPYKIAFAPSGPYWKFMRKILIVELLSPKRLESFRSLRAQEAFGTIRSILHTAAANTNTDNPCAVDLSREVSSLTSNIICRMTFGKKCCEAQVGRSGFKEVLEEQFALSGGFTYADFIPFVGWLDLQGMRHAQARIHKIFDGFLEDIVEEHFQKKNESSSGLDPKDFVDVLISLCDDESMEIKITRQAIKDVIFDVLVAATDTSGITLEWAMSELLRNPSSMNRAQEELDSVIGQDRIVEESDLPHLQYLQSVVKETLRLHPPVPLLLPHESMEHSTVAGYEIPEKTRVLVNAWAIGRDPVVWEEANKFKPERFLGSQMDVKGQDFELLPFGSGRRGCPGNILALCIVQLGLALLLHSFKWYLPQGLTPDNLDMLEACAITMPRAVHIHAIPIPRLPLDLYDPKA